MINKPGLDPYNNKKKLDPFSYSLLKYNAVIILKEFLKHTSQYLNDDVKDWIFKKALQGSKNDYWMILNITTNLFYYYLFRREETINFKKIRLWFRQNPLYTKSNDETIKSFILTMNKYKNCSYHQYLNYLTFEKLYNKVREMEDHNIKYKFIIICDF